MPRARTQWLCWLFQNAGLPAWHDPLANCASPGELVRNVRAVLSRYPHLLIIDTAAVHFHNQLVRAMPGVKRAYLFRNPLDSAESIFLQTGERQYRQLEEHSQRLYRYAFDDQCFRMYHGLIDQRINDFWRFVEGVDMPKAMVERYAELRDTIIDVPLARQPYNPTKTDRLMRYRE